MFILIFNQLLKMLLIMLVAFLCYRIHIVNQEGNRCVSNLLLMVVNPCLIITVYKMDYDPVLVKGLLISFAAAAVSHFISVTAAHFLIPAKDNPEYAQFLIFSLNPQSYKLLISGNLHPNSSIF